MNDFDEGTIARAVDGGIARLPIFACGSEHCSGVEPCWFIHSTDICVCVCVCELHGGKRGSKKRDDARSDGSNDGAIFCLGKFGSESFDDRVRTIDVGLIRVPVYPTELSRIIEPVGRGIR